MNVPVHIGRAGHAAEDKGDEEEETNRDTAADKVHGEGKGGLVTVVENGCLVRTMSQPDMQDAAVKLTHENLTLDFLRFINNR